MRMGKLPNGPSNTEWSTRALNWIFGILGSLIVAAMLAGVGTWAQSNETAKEVIAVDKRSAERKVQVEEKIKSEMAHVREIQVNAEKQNTKEHKSINGKLEKIDDKLDRLLAK